MSDVTKPPREPREPDASDDPIARLIQMAGPRPSVAKERMARVRDGVHLRWREAVRSERRRRVVLAAAPIAAGLAIVVGAAFWLRDRTPIAGAPAATVVRTQGSVLLREGQAAGTGSILQAGSTLTTGSDGRAALRLSGGPSVRLDSGTELRLTSARVLDLLRGAVYVDTGAKPGQASGSIEIRTDLGRVRDVGTQFEVRLATGALQLRVREGIAHLDRDGRTYAAPAGARLRVGSRGAVETGTVALRGEDWDWVLAVAPPFDLEGRTLRDYLDWLARETGWGVAYADPSIGTGAATVILHGSTTGLRPDETPDAVLPACGLRHRLDGGTLIIERAAGKGRPE